MAEFDIQGIPQLRARISAITPNEKLLRTIALSAVREQKLLVPRKTSTLGRSIHLGAVTPTRAETIASAHYATYVERGTRAHEIKPRNRKALRWKSGGSNRISIGGHSFSASMGASRTGAIGGVDSGVARPKARKHRFAKRVMHPGTRAQPFMLPGAQKAVADTGLKATVVAAWNSAA